MTLSSMSSRTNGACLEMWSRLFCLLVLVFSSVAGVSAQSPVSGAADQRGDELTFGPDDFHGRVLDIREAIAKRYPNVRLRRVDLVAVRVWAKTPSEAEFVLEVGRRFRTSKIFSGDARSFEDDSTWSFDAFTLAHPPGRARGDWWLTRLGEVAVLAVKVRLAPAMRGQASRFERHRDDPLSRRGAKNQQRQPFEVAVNISDCRGNVWQSIHKRFVLRSQNATHATFVSSKYGIPQKCKGYNGAYNEEVRVDVPLGSFEFTAESLLAIPPQVTALKCIAKEIQGKAVGCLGVAYHNAQ